MVAGLAGGVLKLDWIILIPEDNYKFKCAGVGPHYLVCLAEWSLVFTLYSSHLKK